MRLQCQPINKAINRLLRLCTLNKPITMSLASKLKYMLRHANTDMLLTPEAFNDIQGCTLPSALPFIALYKLMALGNTELYSHGVYLACMPAGVSKLYMLLSLD